VKTVATLAVGGSGSVTVLLDPGLPIGPWDAKITLESGKTSETVTGRLTFPTGNGTSAAPTTGLTGDSGSPLILIVAVIAGFAIVLLGVCVSVRRRRRRTDSGIAITQSGGPPGQL
jgi:hypothetical protein